MGGTVLKAASVGGRDGGLLLKSIDGKGVCFANAKDDDDEMIARSVLDDRVFMHAVAVVKLPAAANITPGGSLRRRTGEPRGHGGPAGDP